MMIAEFLYPIGGIVGVVILAIYVVRFIWKPISRDQMLVKFGWQYFWFVVSVMVACTLLIALALHMHIDEKVFAASPKTEMASNNNADASSCQYAQTEQEESILTSNNTGWNPLIRAVQFSIKMKEAKDGELNILAFVFIMLFQLLVFEGLVLATIIGWTSRRAKQYTNGEARYELWAFGKSFAVVIGANEVAPSVIKNLLKHEEKGKLDYAHEKENEYVILQTSSDVSEVRQNLQSYLTKDEYDHVIIYSSLRNSYEGLKDLHLEHASEIYVLGENTTVDGGETFHDTMNMRCVNMIANILGDCRGNRIACKVLFEYQTTFSIFQFSDVPDSVHKSMHFIPFNRYDSWARRVIVDNKAKALIDENDTSSNNTKHTHEEVYIPLDGYEGIKYNDTQRVHFIVVGMSKMGVAMGTQALFQAHYPNYVRDNSLKSRITFIDANAEQEMQFFKGRYATLFELARHRYIDANACAKSEVESDYGWEDPAEQSDYKWKHLSAEGKNFLDVEIEFVKGELESEGVREYLRKVTADEKSKVTIAICLPLTHQAVAAALYLPIEVYQSKMVQDIWVYQREAADIITNLEHARETNERYSKLRPFGMLYGEYIDSRTHYLKALLVNAVYDMDGKYKDEYVDMGVPETYTGLSDSWNDLTVALQWSNMYFVDSMYQKLRCMNGDENDTDNMARCEHNRWNVQQLLLGFAPADEQELAEFAQLDANKKTVAANEARSKWRNAVKWNELTEPLERKRAKEHELYKQSPHGIYDEKKNELKHGPCHIHPNIVHYDLLDTYDSGAKGYDETLNQGIQRILNHVDNYKKKHGLK